MHKTNLTRLFTHHYIIFTSRLINYTIKIRIQLTKLDKSHQRKKPNDLGGNTVNLGELVFDGLPEVQILILMAHEKDVDVWYMMDS